MASAFLDIVVAFALFCRSTINLPIIVTLFHNTIIRVMVRLMHRSKKNFKKKKMVQLRSGLGGTRSQSPDPQPPVPRSFIGFSLSSLSAERSQGSDGEAKSSSEGGLANQLSRGPNSDSESYGEETPVPSVTESLRSTPRNHSTSLGLGTPDDQGDVESQFSCKRATHRLFYRGVSTIAKTIEPIHSKNPKEAPRKVKRKVLEIEEERELAV